MGGLAAQAGVCHSQVWMKIGALQLVGVQLLAEVPEVVLQGAFLHAVFQDSHGCRLATQSELGSQYPGGVGSA